MKLVPVGLKIEGMKKGIWFAGGVPVSGLGMWAVGELVINNFYAVGREQHCPWRWLGSNDDAGCVRLCVIWTGQLRFRPDSRIKHEEDR